MSTRWTVPKPARLTLTLYRPMTSAATLKMPAAFDTVVRCACVCRLVTSMVAPGIGRPCSSWTIPVIVPVEMACCAEAKPADASSTTSAAAIVRAAPLHPPGRRVPCGAPATPMTFPPALRWFTRGLPNVSFSALPVEFDDVFIATYARVRPRAAARRGSGDRTRRCGAPGQFVMDAAEHRLCVGRPAEFDGHERLVAERPLHGQPQLTPGERA